MCPSKARTEIDAALFGAEVPDFYSDSVQVLTSLYGMAFDFGLRDMSGDGVKPQAVVRMSPQHAYVFCQVLRKHLKGYEKDIGPIALPDDVFSNLDIDKEL